MLTVPHVEHTPYLAASVDSAHVEHTPYLAASIDSSHVEHTPYLAASVDSTHAESATTSFKELVTVAQENSNQTADILEEDQYSLLWIW